MWEEGYGAIAICKKYNNIHLSGEHEKKLKPATIQAAVDWDEIGVSPAKAGRPAVIPKQFTTALATQETMMQVSAREGKASGQR